MFSEVSVIHREDVHGGLHAWQGHAWQGGCMAWGHAWKVGMHGRGCMQQRRPLKRAERILLESILVYNNTINPDTVVVCHVLNLSDVSPLKINCLNGYKDA